MKVVHLLLNYAPSVGGSQLLFKRVSEGLVRDHDFEVEVWTFNALRNPKHSDPGFIPATDETVEGVVVRRFPFLHRTRRAAAQATVLAERITRRERPATWNGVLRGPLSPAMVAAAIRCDADAVMTGPLGYATCQYGALAHRVRGIPFGVAGLLHATEADAVDEADVRTAIGADRYVAMTRFEAEVLTSRGADASRIEVISPGVDVAQLAGGDPSRLRGAVGWTSTDTVVGYVGRLAAYKGVDVLVHAAARLWQAGRDDVRVLIAGQSTPYVQDLEGLRATLPSEWRDRIRLVLDFAEGDKRHVYAASDVVVSVSGQESFGIVYLEAWAAGRPVIGGRVPAVEHVVRQGTDGLLVAVADAEALAASILRLADDAALRQRLAGAGHRRVSSDHSWEAVTSAWRDLYREMAGERISARRRTR